MRKLLASFAIILILVAGSAGWLWLYGPCGTRRMAEARRSLAEQSEKWSDALKIAAGTPMLALATPVARLQDLKRETKQLQLPKCAEDARGLLVQMMDQTISGFLAFMTATPEQRSAMESDQSPWLIHAKEEMEFFGAEMQRLETCAPMCWRTRVDWSAKRESRENARRDVAARARQEAEQAGEAARAKREGDQLAARVKAEAALKRREAAKVPKTLLWSRDLHEPSVERIPFTVEVMDAGLRIKTNEAHEARFIGCWQIKAARTLREYGTSRVELSIEPTETVYIDARREEEAALGTMMTQLETACGEWKRRYE